MNQPIVISTGTGLGGRLTAPATPEPDSATPFEQEQAKRAARLVEVHDASAAAPKRDDPVPVLGKGIIEPIYNEELEAPIFGTADYGRSAPRRRRQPDVVPEVLGRRSGPKDAPHAMSGGMSPAVQRAAAAVARAHDEEARRSNPVGARLLHALAADLKRLPGCEPEWKSALAAVDPSTISPAAGVELAIAAIDLVQIILRFQIWVGALDAEGMIKWLTQASAGASRDGVPARAAVFDAMGSVVDGMTKLMTEDDAEEVAT